MSCMEIAIPELSAMFLGSINGGDMSRQGKCPFQRCDTLFGALGGHLLSAIDNVCISYALPSLCT